MSEIDESWDGWVQRLVEGNSEEAAEFWAKYGDRLQRVVEKHLDGWIRRRVGPDDVVQSACRSFFRRAKEQQYQLPDSESLWRLLCAITMTKLRNQLRFHSRQRRTPAREQKPEAKPGSDADLFAEVPFDEQSPDHAVQFAEQLELLLTTLDEEERQLVNMKLANHTNDEIATELGCSERTVRRILKRVQTRLKQIFASDFHQTDEPSS